MASHLTAMEPAEIARLLQLTASTLQSLASTVPPRILSWHPEPDEWCITEILGHLTETENRGFAGRIRTMLAEDQPRLETWNQEEVAQSRRDCDKSFEELLAEFLRMRADSIELVERLGPAELRRGAEHVTVGYITVADLLQEWVYHDQNHIRQMLMNLQHSVWPHMANTQRFY